MVPTTIQLRHVETGRFLGWLTDVLKKLEAVSLEIQVVEDANESCSIEISLRDVPAAVMGAGTPGAGGRAFPPASK